MIDGDRLRAWRIHRGLTLRDLGAKAGVAYDSLSRIERGAQAARPATARKLAEALGVALEELTPPPPAPRGVGEAEQPA